MNVERKFRGVMDKEVLFRCYDVVSVESNNVIGRFRKKAEAQLSVDWLNGAAKATLVKLVAKDVTVDDLYNYVSLHRAGFCYKTSQDFVDEFLKRMQDVGNCYNLKDKNKTAFVKIKNYWWELDTATPLNKATVYNSAGGRMTEVDCTKLQIAEATDWQDLNWKGTVVWDNNFKTGWLAPSGEFFGCDYRCHSTCANYVLKSSEQKLEKTGHIKITKMLGRESLEAMIPCYINPKYPKPTSAQIKYLLDRKDISNAQYILQYLDEEMEL